MIEEGIYKAVQASAAVTAIAPTGGFLCTLPEDFALPSWTYQVLGSTPEVGLTIRGGLVTARLQIDCYAETPEQVIALAKAIDAVVLYLRGTLTDTDHTVVDSAVPAGGPDFFDDVRRSYRRVLEYDVWFYQS